jgi:hypothetical protein
MKLYPEVPDRRNAVIARDAALVLLLVLFAWTGWKVYGAVDHVGVLGEGVTSAGNSVQDAFGTVAGTVDKVPVVGSRLADALGTAGSATGGSVADAGTAGTEAVHRLAITLGLLTFGLPTVVLLATTLPRRIALAHDLTAAHDTVGDLSDPARRKLLAERAAMHLPYRVLQRYTADPLGDLAAGRYDALVDASLEEAGLSPRHRVPVA